LAKRLTEVFSNLNRLDRFIFTRRAKTLESIGDQTQMVITVSPAYLRDEIIFNIHDDNLRQIIQNPPHQLPGREDISCGRPYPTLNGLRADQSTPYLNNPSFDQYIEVFSNGYIEFGRRIEREGEHGKYLASLVEIPLIVNFMTFIQTVYEQYLPLTPLVVGFSIYNAKGIWLAASDYRTEGSSVKWQEQHLELGNFYGENVSEERKLLTKGICDRLWQAFNREKYSLFDDAGTFRIPR
jgi:hypothetical protein